MSGNRILVVEDDKNIAKLIQYNIEKAGFVCTVTADGNTALNIIEKEKVDAIILDIMLPGIDGLEVCRRIRKDQKKAAIPIIILTAKGEEVDRIVGLELGADDYIVKPFSPRELVLRIKAVLKRGLINEGAPDILQVGKLIIDSSKHTITLNGKEIDFTPIEFKLLVILVNRKGRVQSRDILLNDVWSIDSYITTRTVDTHMKRLRQKLGKMGNQIKTIRGIGYKFTDEGQ
jgi:two-component system, OmpR family, phosphate regulon response regulator PhoB